MNAIIRDNLDKIIALCSKHKVKTLFAFGSVCTDKFNETSDIDLLVSFASMDQADYADNYFSAVEDFEQVFKRPVDLVSEKSLSNPFFINSINQTKTLLYGRQS